MKRVFEQNQVGRQYGVARYAKTVGGPWDFYYRRPSDTKIFHLHNYIFKKLIKQNLICIQVHASYFCYLLGGKRQNLKFCKKISQKSYKVGACLIRHQPPEFKQIVKVTSFQYVLFAMGREYVCYTVSYSKISKCRIFLRNAHSGFQISYALAVTSDG